MSTQKTPGEKIEKKMDEKGWSQNRLADESGVDVSTINNILRKDGDPKVSTVKKIADSLGVEPGEII